MRYGFRIRCSVSLPVSQLRTGGQRTGEITPKTIHTEERPIVCELLRQLLTEVKMRQVQLAEAIDTPQPFVQHGGRISKRPRSGCRSNSSTDSPASASPKRYRRPSF